MAYRDISQNYTEIEAAAWRIAAESQDLNGFFERLAPLLPEAAHLALLIQGTPEETLTLLLLHQGRSHAGTLPLTPALRGDCQNVQSGSGWSAAPAPSIAALLPPGWPPALSCTALKDGETGAGLMLTDSVVLAEALRQPVQTVLAQERRRRTLTLEFEAAQAERRALMQRLKRPDESQPIVGAQTGLAEVMDAVRQVAATDTPILILGETGAGKEVVARALHTRSHRAGGPFLRVNCGAIPPELIDSELFGHERGSFTGAVGVHKGWFERADGGTLFLDEVGELPAAAQVRLLRVLQDGSFQRVGGERTLNVDVRLVAATNRDLRAAARAGTFREDLWFRIAVFPIPLPPLRERQQDLPALAAHFALRAAERLGLPPRMPDADDLARLTAYPWPGNVRELASVIERAAILGDGRRLEIARALGAAPVASVGKPVDAADESVFPSLDRAMQRHIEAALARCHGRIEGPFGAAQLLEINPHTLRSRMRKLGVAWRMYRE